MRRFISLFRVINYTPPCWLLTVTDRVVSSIFFSNLPRSVWIEPAPPAGRFLMRLVDLAFGSLDEDYPTTERLLLQPEQRGQTGVR